MSTHTPNTTHTSDYVMTPDSQTLSVLVENKPGVLTRVEGGRRYAAAPYDPARPFPLPSLFCFARIRRIGGQDYAVFAFDAQGRPVF